MTFIQNNLVLEHRNDCELRHFADPMGPRHLANEISAATVDALMTAAERHQATVQRDLSAQRQTVRGLDPLYDYDRYAPLFPDQPQCDWPTARDIVQSSYEAFSPKAGAVIREFFEKRWIDATLRPGKRSGAFSSSAVPSVHPYILMNFTDKLRDVMTLAHELGHGLHQYLSRPIGYLQCDTPLTTAEMASVFGEMLTFQRLQKIYTEPRIRLAMLCSKIEDGFATVFRQVVLTRSSKRYTRNGTNRASCRPSTQRVVDGGEPPDARRRRTPDGGLRLVVDVHRPFHSCAVLLLRLRVRRTAGAGPRAEIQAGRGRFCAEISGVIVVRRFGTPHVLLARVGVDVTDPQFWELGLRLLGDMVAEAEQLAANALNSPIRA